MITRKNWTIEDRTGNGCSYWARLNQKKENGDALLLEICVCEVCKQQAKRWKAYGMKEGQKYFHIDSQVNTLNGPAFRIDLALGYCKEYKNEAAHVHTWQVNFDHFTRKEPANAETFNRILEEAEQIFLG